LALLLVAGAVAHIRYLNHNCPIDLSGDEAQYWDWSRQLDLSYYSKGPLVAYIIRASCAIFGEAMPAVRYPAIMLGLGTSIVTYLLTTKIFGSERLALAAVLLNAVVPLFVAGSIFMTIDPPLFFCWACATYFFALAIFDRRGWAWIAVGVFVGIGFLAKYAMFLWLLSMWIFVARAGSPCYSKRGPLVATGIALLITIPVIVWNAQHGWVSLRHVAHQTGTSGGSFSHGNFFELIGSQIGVLGPVIVALMTGGIVYTLGARDEREPRVPQLRMLVWLGVPFFVLTALSSLVTKAQVNWPAPAYFTLMILAAYYLATRMRNPPSWKRWRLCIYATIAIGAALVPIVHDPSLLFPPIRLINRALPRKMQMKPGPMLTKIAGWQILGEHVGRELSTLGPGAFVLCDDYMQTAETAFYTPGQPRTYYAGSYYISDPKRMTQYDVWPDRRLDETSPLIGLDAIYVGKGGEVPPEIPSAFARIQKLDEIPVVVRGELVKSFKLWRCYNFKGMHRPREGQSF
jgi:undecaprenyl-diphosphatase